MVMTVRNGISPISGGFQRSMTVYTAQEKKADRTRTSPILIAEFRQHRNIGA